jgi:hypothetical protein
MQPIKPLKIQCETSYRGLTPSDLARIEIEFPGNNFKRAWVNPRLHSRESMHREAILDAIGTGFKLRIIEETLSGYVWEISVPRDNRYSSE